MTESEVKDTAKTGRTPSMTASLLVLGVMIVLILLSVASFGGTVADGPLQVSMTLATLFALSVAYYYNFRGSVISQAILDGVNGTVGTMRVEKGPNPFDPAKRTNVYFSEDINPSSDRVEEVEVADNPKTRVPHPFLRNGWATS